MTYEAPGYSTTLRKWLPRWFGLRCALRLCPTQQGRRLVTVAMNFHRRIGDWRYGPECVDCRQLRGPLIKEFTDL